MSSKTFFILPGFKESVEHDRYSWLVDFLHQKQYKVVAVPVIWNNKTLSQNTQDFVSFFETHKGDVNYILGFSYGAVIALMASSAIRADKLYLCSLSPDFSEDIDMMPPWIMRYIGKRRYTEAQTRRSTILARTLQTPTILFYGEAEGIAFPSLKICAERVARIAPHAIAHEIPGASHDISHAAYQEAIIRAI
jgi:pimeloyl-ACP methyl ester carboxylesterase